MKRDIDVSPSWRRSARAIIVHRLRKVLVIGALDRGKSTYCEFLASSFRAAGATVAFVDGDIGQKDVGPPATISLARLDGGSFARTGADLLYFVGDVNPVGHFLPMVIGVQRLVDAANGDFVVVDTPGLIAGAGRALNAYQIESLRPDVIVALQCNRELEPTLRAFREHRIFRLHPSPRAVHKPAAARRRARERAFRAHLSGGRSVALDMKRLSVQRTRLFAGEPFRDARFTYAERTPEGVIAVGASSVSERGWRVLSPDFADHLLCAVLDAAGECRGLGIIERIDFASGELHLYVPVDRVDIRALQFGDLYLERDGYQLGRRSPGLF